MYGIGVFKNIVGEDIAIMADLFMHKNKTIAKIGKTDEKRSFKDILVGGEMGGNKTGGK